MEIDEEARALAWRRAALQQPQSVVRAQYRPEEWATRPDPTAILDEPATEEIDRVLLGDLLRDDAADAVAYTVYRAATQTTSVVVGPRLTDSRDLYAWVLFAKYRRPPPFSTVTLC